MNPLPKLILAGIGVFCALLGFGQSNYVRSIGSPTQDEALDIASDHVGRSYPCGYFTSTVDYHSAGSAISAGLSDVFLARYSNSGVLEWELAEGGPGPDKALSIATDNAGFIYVTGFFSGTANFSGTTLTSAGNEDVFIAKYTEGGVLQWAVSAGGPGPDLGNSIAVAPSGDVVVCGQFVDSASFGATTMGSMIDPTTQQPSVDVFITQLDPFGNFVWAQQGAAPFSDRGLGVAVGPMGEVNVIGQFTDDITFDVFHANTMNNAIFLVQFDSNGNEQWFHPIGAGSQNIGYDVTCDATGNIYLTGDFLNSVTFFGPSVGSGGTSTAITGTYPNNVFVARYTPSGLLDWTQHIGSQSAVSSRSIALDQTNDVFICGQFECRFNGLSDMYGQGLFNSIGYKDIYVVRMDSTGALERAYNAGGHSNDLCLGIDIDSDGEIAVAGSFTGDFVVPGSANYISGLPSTSNAGPNFHPDTFPLTLCGTDHYSTFFKTPGYGNLDAFTGKVFDHNRAPYDYFKRDIFGPCNTDYVDVCINSLLLDNACEGDSLELCGSGNVRAGTQTAISTNLIGEVGPNFTWQWSSGITSSQMTIANSGSYSVTITSEDGCFVSSDTVYITVHDLPQQPLITDSEGTNNNAAFATPITFCVPDSVQLSTASLSGNDSLLWVSEQLDSVGVSGNSVWIDTSSIVTIVRVDSNGCSNSTTVELFEQEPDTLDPLLPRMVFINDSTVHMSDTLPMCTTTTFGVMIYDSLDNPSMLIDEISNTSTFWNSDPPLPPSSNASITSYLPLQSGWIVVSAIMTHFTPNECFIDSAVYVVTDSIYIDLIPLPTVNLTLTGDTVACPGDTATFIASGGNEYMWTPTSQVHQTSVDSVVQATEPGTYSVVVSYEDTLTGCIGNFGASLVLIAPDIPSVTMDPPNGIICPNDSVTIAASNGLAYQWFGPNGGIAQNQQVSVSSPGFYFCAVTDQYGCQLITNTVEVIQYASPLVQSLPDSTLCPGGSLTLAVNTTDTGSVAWQAPLSGNTVTQTISQPGTYTVEVSTCGLIETVSITIDTADVVAVISPAGPVYMYDGDTVAFTGNGGMAAYNWSNGDTMQTAQVTDSGFVTLTTTNADGCSITSDPVQVIIIPFVVLPIVSDTVICGGTTAALYAISTDTIFWYDTLIAGTPLFEGNPWQTPPLSETTTFFCEAADVLGNHSLRVPLTVYVIDPVVPPSIATNEPVCAGDTLFLSTIEIPGAQYSWAGPSGFTENGLSTFVANTSAANSGLYTLSLNANNCPSPDSVVQIEIHPIPNAPIIVGPDTVCLGDSIFLAVSGDSGTFNWTGPAGSNSLSDSLFFDSITQTDSGMYAVYVTSPFGCESPSTTHALTAIPVPEQPQLVGPSQLCVGDSLLVFTAAVASANYNWNTPTGNFSGSNTIFIPFVSLADSGLYRLELHFGDCSSPVDSHEIAVLSGPNAQIIGLEGVHCEGDTLTLSASPDLGLGIQWSTPTGEFSASELILEHISASDSGMYVVRIASNDCPGFAIDTLLVTPAPTVNLGPDTAFCTGGSVVLDAGSFSNYLWSDQSTLASVVVGETGTWSVIVWDSLGCRAYDTTNVEVSTCSVFVPNVMTPNGDGYNDGFRVQADGISWLYARIYNRWGQQVGDLPSTTEVWDGTDPDGNPVPDGVYFYSMEWEDQFGNKGSKNGNIMLMRSNQ